MEDENKTPVYELDDDTLSLVEVCLNCMISLSEVQMNDDDRENLQLIADELANRFNIATAVIAQETTVDGETIYRPKGGVFGDLDDEPEEK